MTSINFELDDRTIAKIVAMTTESVMKALDARSKSTPPAAGDDDYLSRKELAAFLNICPVTVDHMLKKGELPRPSFGRGHSARWRRGDVRRHTVQSQPRDICL